MSVGVHPVSGRSKDRRQTGPIAYVMALGLVWLVSVFFIGAPRSLSSWDLLGIGVLVAMEIISIATRGRGATYAASSYSTVILLACVAMYGPLVASVLALVTALVDRRYGLSIVPVFNALMMANMAVAGGVVYVLLGGYRPIPDHATSRELLLRVGAPMLGADVAMFVVNVIALLVMLVITGANTRALLVGSARELAPLFVGYALVAFVFVLLWGPAGVGPLSAVLMTAPLAIARFVYVQYGDEVRAHERIVGMFTRAADGPEGRLALQGARVDELCQLMAAQLGLPEQDRRSLSHAAHLHDVAMKAVLRATDTLRGGTGPYTNVRALLPHPVLAERIVAGVDFLGDAAPSIRSHHERMDGRGYPDGLAGEEIPLTARILAVADAYDALTTTRGDRAALDTDGALAELRLSAGSHLDSAVLEALTLALRGREQPGHDLPLNEGSWLWDHHTLPAMSDVIADERLADRPPDRPDRSEWGERAERDEGAGPGDEPEPAGPVGPERSGHGPRARARTGRARLGGPR